MANTQTVSWVVRTDQKVRLERIAKRKICSVSYLIRQAIDEYLENMERRQAQKVAG